MKRLAAALTIIAVSSPCLAEQRPEWAFVVPTPAARIQVREAKRVPASLVDPNSLMRTVLAGRRTEPLGSRIVELPENESGLRNRNSPSGSIAYVPEGSIAKGKRIVTRADEWGVTCTSCHGKTLNGRGGVPPLAGRSPTYLVRQLWDFQNGERRGSMAAPMRAIAARLRVDEMLAMAAYLASLAANGGD
jgi:cytochrome c553